MKGARHRCRPVKNRRFILKPEPAGLPDLLRSEDDIALHRRLDCGHYDGCLTQSVRENWVSFTCRHCPLRDVARPAARQNELAHQRISER